MKILNHEVADPLILGAITLASYSCVISYQAGKLATYGIPSVFIDISIKSTIQSWISLAPFLVLVTLFEATLFTLAGYLVVGLLALVHRLHPLLLTWSMRAWSRFVRWLFGNTVIDTAISNFETIFLVTLPVFVLISVMISSFILGTSISHFKRNYLVDSADPTCLIVLTTDSRYLCVNYDSGTKIIQKRFRIRDITNGTAFSQIQIPKNKKPLPNELEIILRMLDYFS